MPFFSFSLNSVPKDDIQILKQYFPKKFKLRKKYLSKSTQLWKILNNKKFLVHLKSIKREKRKKIIIKKKKSILFCLPPSIGLGDSVEYALAIKAIINSSQFDKIAVAFVGRFREIFLRYFNIKDVYPYLISDEDFKSYDNIFHFTFEIEDLFYQKYDRKNIEQIIINFFSVPRFKFKKIKKLNSVKKISIFPISNSPIRSMTSNLLNFLINNLHKKFNIQVVLDQESLISNFIDKKIVERDSIKRIIPSNLDQLLNYIENIEFGIFMDSGPLHIAKILSKRGVLISSTVSEESLLFGYENIKSVKNNYSSRHCKAPCGLTNIFNFNNLSGCYDSLNISKTELIKKTNLKDLQRGNLKKNYIKFLLNPVNCLKTINNVNVLDCIKNSVN